MLKRGSASRGSLPADWPTNKAFFGVTDYMLA